MAWARRWRHPWSVAVVAVPAPRPFPRAPFHQFFLRGASVKAKRVLPPALFSLDGQRRLLGVVSGAMAPDTYSSAERSSGGSGVAGHGSGSSGSHSKSARVLRFLGSLSSSGGGGFGEKTPLRRRTRGGGLNLVFIGVALGFGREGGRLVVRLSDVASIHDCQRKRAAAMGGRRARASLYACVSGEEKGE